MLNALLGNARYTPIPVAAPNPSEPIVRITIANGVTPYHPASTSRVCRRDCRSLVTIWSTIVSRCAADFSLTRSSFLSRAAIGLRAGNADTTIRNADVIPQSAIA